MLPFELLTGRQNKIFKLAFVSVILHDHTYLSVNRDNIAQFRAEMVTLQVFSCYSAAKIVLN